MLQILGAIQAEYGYVPVAALKRVSEATGAWYAMLYGTATYYDHLAVGAAATDPTSADSAFRARSTARWPGVPRARPARGDGRSASGG